MAQDMEFAARCGYRFISYSDGFSREGVRAVRLMPECRVCGWGHGRQIGASLAPPPVEESIAERNRFDSLGTIAKG